MGLKVKLPNAFSINKLGLNKHPFPMGVSINQNDAGLFTLSLFPQRLIDMVDLLDSLELCIVFGVDHLYFDMNTKHSPSLSQIAISEGISYTEIDSNTIAISMENLKQLLSFLPHYDFSMFNMPVNSNQEDIITNVLNYEEFKWKKDQPLLTHLTGSSVFLSIHDDCYMKLEMYDVNLLQNVFERALQIYVGTVMIEAIGMDEVEVGSVSSELLHPLCHENQYVTILREETEITGSEVKVRVSNKKFDFLSQQEYPTGLVLFYNHVTQLWNMGM